jgi:hypothetical protein
MLAFRRGFEAVVLARHGTVDQWHAKQLRTAAKAFAAAYRCDWVLARAGEPGTKLTHSEYLGYLDRSVKFEAECDKALRSIGLDRTANPDPWDAAFPACGLPAAPLPVQAPVPAPDGSEATKAAPTHSEASQGPSQAIRPPESIPDSTNGTGPAVEYTPEGKGN